MDLVEQQHKGIFSVLDEACMNVGKVTDEVFLQGLNGKLAKHAHYTSRKVDANEYTSDLELQELVALPGGRSAENESTIWMIE